MASKRTINKRLKALDRVTARFGGKPVKLRKWKPKPVNDAWRRKTPKPHPLGTELCLLKGKLMDAGLLITAGRLGIAIKAIGWEIAARAADPPCPPLPDYLIPAPYSEKGRAKAQAKHEAQHKRACASAKRTAWKEIEKLPKCPL